MGGASVVALSGGQGGRSGIRGIAEASLPLDSCPHFERVGTTRLYFALRVNSSTRPSPGPLRLVFPRMEPSETWRCQSCGDCAAIHSRPLDPEDERTCAGDPGKRRHRARAGPTPRVSGAPLVEQVAGASESPPNPSPENVSQPAARRSARVGVMPARSGLRPGRLGRRRVDALTSYYCRSRLSFAADRPERTFSRGRYRREPRGRRSIETSEQDGPVAVEC